MYPEARDMLRITSCVISSGAVIGSEGFGNAKDQYNQWHAIAHLGDVIIGDDVSIGANTTIDRGSIDNTEVHDGVKIDNLFILKLLSAFIADVIGVVTLVFGFTKFTLS